MNEKNEEQSTTPSKNKSLTEKERSQTRNSLLDEQFVKVIENRHAVMVCAFLDENGPCSKSDIYTAISRNPNMPKKLELLEESGLITRRPVLGKYQEIIELTEAGHDFVEGIKKLEAILG